MRSVTEAVDDHASQLEIAARTRVNTRADIDTVHGQTGQSMIITNGRIEELFGKVEALVTKIDKALIDLETADAAINQSLQTWAAGIGTAMNLLQQRVEIAAAASASTAALVAPLFPTGPTPVDFQATQSAIAGLSQRTMKLEKQTTVIHENQQRASARISAIEVAGGDWWSKAREQRSQAAPAQAA